MVLPESSFPYVTFCRNALGETSEVGIIVLLYYKTL